LGRQTLRNYRTTIRRFLDRWPVPPDALTPEHVERFLDALGVTPQSQAQYLARLRSFFAFLVRRGVLSKNPTDDVDPPRTIPHYRPALSRAEFEAVRRACQTPEERLLVEFTFFTGIRLAELRGLRVADMDLESRRAYIRSGKGGRSRVVIFPPAIAEAARAHFRPGQAWLLESRAHPGYARGPAWIEQTLKRLGREAQVPYPLTCHILRHGFTLMCKRAGVPLEVCSRLMGHTSIAITASIYGRLDDDFLQDSYDRMITGEARGGPRVS
jgi:integrase